MPMMRMLFSWSTPSICARREQRVQRASRARTGLGEKLVDDAVTYARTAAGRPTLLADGIQLVKDDDVQTALVALGFVLLRVSQRNTVARWSRTSFSASANSFRMFSSD